MKKQELINYCLTLQNAIETYPFDETTTVIKHNKNNKMFALIYEKEDTLFISLKCEPVKAEVLREHYKGVVAGYHLNKKHWNTINTNLDVPLDEIKSMITHSYNLIKPKK